MTTNQILFLKEISKLSARTVNFKKANNRSTKTLRSKL